MMKTSNWLWVGILIAGWMPGLATGEIGREHVLQTGPSERLVEDPPADIEERAEALVDAIWAKDYGAFVEAGASPETGELGTFVGSEEGFEKVVKEFRNFYRGETLRTMRHPPKWPAPEGKRPWVRVSVQRLDSKKFRGQFIFIFDPMDWSLQHVTLNLYAHADLPQPDAELENDIVRDRANVSQPDD